VIHAHRLPRLEDVEVDPEIRKTPLALEVAECPEATGVAPADLPGVDDEPALAAGP
jgi:hypothetical protein